MPRISAASLADLDAMLAVMALAFDRRFGEAWSGAQLTGTLTQDGAWAALARDRGAVVGFSLSRMIVDEAELLLVAVVPEVRGRGVGAALVGTVAKIARASGARALFLEMRDGNAAAAALYRAQGFVEIGRRRDYYRGENSARFDSLTMRRDLGTAIPVRT